MIKNLLFDLGGVIMSIRRENCVEALRLLGMTDADKFLGEYSQQGPFGDLESGAISPEEFRNQIRSIIGRDIPDADIDAAFGKFLLGIPEHRLDELTALHSQYRLYMLSNTNPIMWHDGIARAFAQQGHDVNFYFDGIIKSYEEHSMKPDLQIFKNTITKLGIDPEETIFLDDSRRNLEAAASVGFRVILVNPGDEFAQLLAQFPDGQQL